MSSRSAKPAPASSTTMLERVLSIEIVRVTERAAVAAARLRGRGNEKEADQAAVDAMRREMNKLPIEGTIVIGEGERDEAPMLFIGEKVGKGGPKLDIAVDPLEGTTLCAKNMPGARHDPRAARHARLIQAHRSNQCTRKRVLFCPSPFQGYWMSCSSILAAAALAAFHKFMTVAWSPEANSAWAKSGR